MFPSQDQKKENLLCLEVLDRGNPYYRDFEAIFFPTQ
jgi:hypothetical protein